MLSIFSALTDRYPLYLSVPQHLVFIDFNFITKQIKVLNKQFFVLNDEDIVISCIFLFLNDKTTIEASLFAATLKFLFLNLAFFEYFHFYDSHLSIRKSRNLNSLYRISSHQVGIALYMTFYPFHIG